MRYEEVVSHFIENNNVALLVPNATVRNVFIEDILNQKKTAGFHGQRIFSFNDFHEEKPVSSLIEAFILEEVLSAVNGPSIQKASFYELVQRTLKTLQSAMTDVDYLEKAGGSKFLCQIYQKYCHRLAEFGSTKSQIFQRTINHLKEIKKTKLSHMEEIMGLGVGATHFLEKKFLEKIQELGILYYDLSGQWENDPPKSSIHFQSFKNRLEEVQQVYKLAKHRFELNPQNRQVFVFKNLHAYKDLLKSYFPASFYFHPPTDVINTPCAIFIFELLEMIANGSDVEKKLNNSYISTIIPKLTFFEALQFPKQARFYEYCENLQHLLSKIQIIDHLHQRRDLKVLSILFQIIEEVRALELSQRQTDLKRFVSFLKLVFSHHSFSENRKNGCAFAAYDYRNVTFWCGEVTYLLGFYEDSGSLENPLLPDRVIFKLNELYGEKRMMERSDRKLQERKIILSYLSQAQGDIYISRPRSLEKKITRWPSYLHERFEPDSSDHPSLSPLPSREGSVVKKDTLGMIDDNPWRSNIFYPDFKSASTHASILEFEGDSKAFDIYQALYAIDKKKFRTLRHSLSFHKALSTVEELSYVWTNQGVRHHMKKIFSASALESFSNCGFRYYVENILGIREEEESPYELTALERGRLYHTILFRFYSLRKKRGKARIEIQDLPEVRKQMQWAVESSFKEFQRPAFWRIDQKKILNHLLKFCELETQSSSDPQFFEKRFQWSTGLKDFFHEEIVLRGVMDRLDFNGDEFEVLDYKTGSTLPTLVGIERGEHFQLPLYFVAAQNVFFPGREGAALFYQLTALQRKSKLSSTKFEKIESVFFSQLRKHVSRLKRGEFYRRFDHCNYCTLDALCRLEKK
ncbi:MAG: PD-(D/E)XK nuclease family protein [Deltaproteobacteria bacterium]|nr:PD-(D/E)XK nuclease family protein [Deltaproteobacteria bacterium]